MFQKLSRKASIVTITAGVALAGCGKPPAETTTVKPIDDNHFLVTLPQFDGHNWCGSEVEFATALADFRKSHPGEFVIIPSDQRYAFSGTQFVAVRKTAAYEAGKSNISLASDSSPDHKGR